MQNARKKKKKKEWEKRDKNQTFIHREQTGGCQSEGGYGDGRN